jgi:hypothetical protein
VECTHFPWGLTTLDNPALLTLGEADSVPLARAGVVTLKWYAMQGELKSTEMGLK